MEIYDKTVVVDTGVSSTTAVFDQKGQLRFPDTGGEGTNCRWCIVGKVYVTRNITPVP